MHERKRAADTVPTSCVVNAAFRYLHCNLEKDQQMLKEVVDIY
jgi:hypothetical protein